ncbi:MAG: phage baseplate plug protein [bacterium]
MSLSIIPLQPIPNYCFKSKVPVDGMNKNLTFKLTYNLIAEYWLLELKDEQNNVLLSAIPLIPGEGKALNILEQYSYLQIGAAYIVPVESINEEYPSINTLGSKWALVWGDTA